MIWAMGFYWLCAGLANTEDEIVRQARKHVDSGFNTEPSLTGWLWAFAFGGIAIPTRILVKLASDRPTHVINHHVSVGPQE